MVTMNLPLDDNLAKALERLLADVEQGRREIAEGKGRTSEQVRQDLARRREERRR